MRQVDGQSHGVKSAAGWRVRGPQARQTGRYVGNGVAGCKARKSPR